MPLPKLIPETAFILAEYGTPGELYHACEHVRDAGYRKWDAHSPFPVHGLDKAMGAPPSRVPWIALAAGLSFGGGGMLMQWWMSAVDYPLVISGKPLFSWQAFVPVTFELAVLGAALGSLFGMLALNELPQFYHPLFKSARFERHSDDGFFISIDTGDPNFHPDRTRALLEKTGAKHIEFLDP